MPNGPSRKHSAGKKHSRAIVLNKKWCLRGVALLSLAIVVLSFLFAQRVSRIAAVGGVICLILAEFADE